MLTRLPRHVPPLETMLADLGNPSSRALGRALGVSQTTAARWRASGQAPRSAMLALFYVTRWGQSQVHCEAHNDALLHSQMASSLRHQLRELHDRYEADIAALTAQLERVSRLASFGAANDPLNEVPRGVPMLPLIAVPGEPQPSPKPNVQSRKKTASQKRAELAARRLEKRASGEPKPFDFLRAEKPARPAEPRSNQPASIDVSIENRPVEPGQPTGATMHIPYVRVPKEPRRNRWVTESGFRLIRIFGPDHNADRFRHHFTWEMKRDRRTQSGRRFAMKLRRINRARA